MCSIYLGEGLIAGGSTFRPNIFDTKWADHLVNDIQWLRADTFSWQDGTVYVTAYNELNTELTNLNTSLYCFADEDDYEIFTTTETPIIGSSVYVETDSTPMHLEGTVTSVSGTDIVYNGVTYSRTSFRDRVEPIYTLEGTVYCVRTAKGYKIAPANQEANVLAKYNSYGIAWYYILDTTNTRFKLPRTKFGFEGVRGNVGDDIAESLPNITGKLSQGEYSGQPINPEGAFSSTGESDTYHKSLGVGSSIRIKFDASLSSSTYQDNAPVQERATQMYLYFYVGEYSQSAIEQTAGITSEQLNAKIDISAGNLSTQGKEVLSSLSMPGTRVVDLTLGASGSVYTAPANGWLLLIRDTGNTNQWIYMGRGDVPWGGVRSNCYLSGGTIGVIFPYKKGQPMYVSYSAAGTIHAFKFIYADGEST